MATKPGGKASSASKDSRGKALSFSTSATLNDVDLEAGHSEASLNAMQFIPCLDAIEPVISPAPIHQPPKNFEPRFKLDSGKKLGRVHGAWKAAGLKEPKDREEVSSNTPRSRPILGDSVQSLGSRSTIDFTGPQTVDFQDADRQLLETIHATVFFRDRTPSQTRTQSERVPIASVLYEPAQGENDVLQKYIGSGNQVCWIHFPANNMNWVHRLMLRLERLQEKELLSDLVLREEYCAEQQTGDSVKYMAPMCTEISTSVQSNDQPGILDTFGIFMPYLEWEKYSVQLGTHEVIKDITQSQLRQNKMTPSEIMQLQCSVYERLLRMYLDPELLIVPIHPRRTLDQAYYTRLDTRARDSDQVVFRYTRDVKKPADGPSMIMVDQCWLWLINKDIVISCFPEPECSEGLGKERHGVNGADDRVSTHIKNWLSHKKNVEGIETGYDLAVVVMDHCASSLVSRGGLRNRVEFNDAFQQSIGNVMDKQTELFKLFLKNSRFLQKLYKAENDATQEGNKGDVSRSRANQDKLLGNLLNIARETRILREIKDIMDELTIIAYINREQSNILKEFSSFPNPTVGKKCKKRAKFRRSKRQVSNTEKLVAASKERTKIISDLYNSADQAYKAIIDLLDLKQKHANVSEARSARRSAEEASRQAEETTQQGHSIMLFTVVTIVFLPLSSLAAIFSLLQVANAQMQLGISLAYILPISSFVIALSFLLAFHQGLRSWTIARSKAIFGKVGDITGFNKLFGQGQSHQSERAQLFERMIEDVSDEDTDDLSDE